MIGFMIVGFGIVAVCVYLLVLMKKDRIAADNEAKVDAAALIAQQKIDNEASIKHIRDYSLTEEEHDAINNERIKRGFSPISFEDATTVVRYRQSLPFESLQAENISGDASRIETMFEFLVSYAGQVSDLGIGNIVRVLNKDSLNSPK